MAKMGGVARVPAPSHRRQVPSARTTNLEGPRLWESKNNFEAVYYIQNSVISNHAIIAKTPLITKATPMNDTPILPAPASTGLLVALAVELEPRPSPHVEH